MVLTQTTYPSSRATTLYKADAPGTVLIGTVLVTTVLIVTGLVGTMLVDAVLVAAVLVGTVLVGTMLVGTMLVDFVRVAQALRSNRIMIACYQAVALGTVSHAQASYLSISAAACCRADGFSAVFPA